MLLPILALGNGVIAQGTVTVGHNSAGSTCTTVTRGYGSHITDTPGSISVDFTPATINKISRSQSAGAGCASYAPSALVEFSQAVGFTTIQVSVECDNPATLVGVTWVTLTNTVGGTYTNPSVGLDWGSLDTGEVKKFQIRGVA